MTMVMPQFLTLTIPPVRHWWNGVVLSRDHAFFFNFKLSIADLEPFHTFLIRSGGIID